MKSNLDFFLLLISDCVFFILLMIYISSQKVRIDELHWKIDRQQVQLEHQALDIMVLKGK